MSPSRIASNARIWIAVAAGAWIIWGTGCKTAESTIDEDFPRTVEAVVEAEPSEQERIEYIEVQPWSARQGEPVEVTVMGTPGRTAKLRLVGLDGAAEGVEKVIDLVDDGTGRYTARFVPDASLPPGQYKLEAELTGTLTGEPVRLVSSRALTLAEAAPPAPSYAQCEAAKKKLDALRAYFAFDKSNLDAAAMSVVGQMAGSLAGARGEIGRVVIEGHCDERGTLEYNLALGARRASAVRDALLAKASLSGLSIETLSKGEEEPVIPNARTVAEHAQNRRALVLLECGSRW
ncbi:MAG: OmpA family protein [Acidobacteriota bacterium]|nr:MAG: OmpA family protein [Acidobacteriota bacterium]